MAKASKKKTRPPGPPTAPPPNGSWRAYDLILEEEDARVEIALPGGGGVIVYGNGYVDGWA